MALALAVACQCSYARAEIELPLENLRAPIRLAADNAAAWREGNYDVWLLAGNCTIAQGKTTARSQQAAVWVELERYGNRTGKLWVYLEEDVLIEIEGDRKTNKLRLPTWVGMFESIEELELRLPAPQREPAVKPSFYRRAVAAREPAITSQVQRTQFLIENGGGPSTRFGNVGASPVSQLNNGFAPNVAGPQGFQPILPDRSPPNAVPGTTPLPVGQPEIVAGPPGSSLQVAAPDARRLRIFRRNEAGYNIKYFPSQQQGEWIALVSGGVNFIVDGLPEYGALDIRTDRMVVWTGGLEEPDLTPNAETLQRGDTPLELYLEGNIEFRQGDRIIEAQRMYYDVRNKRGVVLAADLLTPVPNYQGLLRLRAEVLQQTAEDRFVARNAFITSSRMGRPGYRVQAEEIAYSDAQRPAVDPFTGAPVVGPDGEQVVQHEKLATSFNNFVFIDEVPVFYWPTLATDLEDPDYFIKRVRFRQDRVFGTQILFDFDAYQLFGIKNPPPGTEWEFSLDYLSDRGPAAGTSFRYDVPAFIDMNSPAKGFVDMWGIYDQGEDNLGSDRRAVPPETDFRGRILANHRQRFDNNFQLTGEFGLVSDRNFLEQYYEGEWDTLKDQITGVELKQTLDNMSWSVTGDVRLNEYFAQTQWARLDHFWLGQSLLDDRLTWYEHSSLAYGDFRASAPPDNPVDILKWGPLAWEVTNQGERLVTRQEIDYPLEAGPVKLVPYALGELGHWGADLFGDDLDRAYGQVGLRASIPFWTANPDIENTLFNVHGIAHKIVLDADLSFADTNHDVTELPLYDHVDDDAIEAFRRRFAFNTFGTIPSTIPAKFDERFYAIRSGVASNVTSNATEVVDDLTALRFGARQRWQTKRGLPGERRIIDWMTLDTEGVFYPDDDDNFGENFGLFQYDYKWHVGDRLTLLSDGVYDFFDEGQGLTSVGGYLTRPPRGSLYLGYQSLQGPIDSKVISGSYSYRMSPKWISSFGASYNLSGGNIGQQLTLTRIGESFLSSFAFNVDASKGNVGFLFSLEPRFLPKTKLGNVAGAPIPIAGAMGLE